MENLAMFCNLYCTVYMMERHIKWRETLCYLKINDVKDCYTAT
jgi:hypothetical protein